MPAVLVIGSLVRPGQGSSHLFFLGSIRVDVHSQFIDTARLRRRIGTRRKSFPCFPLALSAPLTEVLFGRAQFLIIVFLRPS